MKKIFGLLLAICLTCISCNSHYEVIVIEQHEMNSKGFRPTTIEFINEPDSLKGKRVNIVTPVFYRPGDTSKVFFGKNKVFEDSYRDFRRYPTN